MKKMLCKYKMKWIFVLCFFCCVASPLLASSDYSDYGRPSDFDNNPGFLSGFGSLLGYAVIIILILLVIYFIFKEIADNPQFFVRLIVYGIFFGSILFIIFLSIADRSSSKMGNNEIIAPVQNSDSLSSTGNSFSNQSQPPGNNSVQIYRTDKITCSKCGGTGTIVVASCECTKCSGTGQVLEQCGNCQGTGQVKDFLEHNQTCPVCHGHLLIEKTCTACNGTGRMSSIVTCSNCNGTGKISQ